MTSCNILMMIHTVSITLRGPPQKQGCKKRGIRRLKGAGRTSMQASRTLTPKAVATSKADSSAGGQRTERSREPAAHPRGGSGT